MSKIEIRSYFDVTLQDCMGSDEQICKAARVSNVGAASIESKESEGLLRFLMANRHGSPFEHGSMTFLITAPIFVWREFMRHRIGFSYNEQSGRYMEMLPIFYIPPEDRPLVQQGKPGAYTFVPGSDAQYWNLQSRVKQTYQEAWNGYQALLDHGIAKEVARIQLPLAIYSSAWVTCNPRSLMSFLSLRTKYEGSSYPSYPQWEIEQVARRMEQHFHKVFPMTSLLFRQLGSVSP